MMPLPWIHVLLGVSHRAIVRWMPPKLFESGSHSWTTPLPYVFVPITLATPRSCSAPVTISAAEAVLPSTRITTCMAPLVAWPPAVASISVSVLLASCCQYTGPDATNSLAILPASPT